MNDLDSSAEVSTVDQGHNVSSRSSAQNIACECALVTQSAPNIYIGSNSSYHHLHYSL